uniref:P3 putative protease n=1 Tax=Xanthi chryso-like virus TaxID=2805777 RepID=A0A889IQ87_9VIRU|nr:MAG: P3 putative protease [Xanthi chryso-like virus]
MSTREQADCGEPKEDLVPMEWNVVHPVTNQKISVHLTSQPSMSKVEFFELLVKTGTCDEFLTIGDDELSVLMAMSNLRRCRMDNLARQEYINARARKVVSDPGPYLEDGGTAGITTRPSSALSIHEWDPDFDEGTGPSLVAHGRHINDNIMMSEFWGRDDKVHEYKLYIAGGFRVTVRSKEPFTDLELMQARDQVRMMLTDPLLEEELVMQKGMKDMTLELPSTQSALKDGYKLLEWLRVGDQLDKASDHVVVVKDTIEGVPPPYPIQLLQEFPSPTSTVRYDYEFSPGIREPWMAECHAGVLPSFDRESFNKKVGPVLPVVRYPDLPIGSASDNSVEIDGKRFHVIFDQVSGVVDKITPLKEKYKLEESRKKVKVGGIMLTTNYAQPKRAGLKNKYTMGKCRRLVIEMGQRHMVPILYTILLCSAVVPKVKAQFICGDDKHGTLWTMPDHEDCMPAENSDSEVELRVYTKMYDYNMTVYRCYKTVRSDTTIYGFFGPKSHLGYTTKQSSLHVSDCQFMAQTKSTGSMKLSRVGDNSWSTQVRPEIKYTWCCSETVTHTENYHLEEVHARVHLVNGYAVIVSSDSDIGHCNYNAGNCTSITSTYIWEKRDLSCDIKQIGQGSFSFVPDGHSISYDLQLSLMIGDEVNYCGVTYNTTEQGLLVQVLSRRKRDVDAAEKNYILKAANVYARKMSMGMFYSLCNFERMWTNYLTDMAKSNPTRFARTYLNRHDVAAKFVGEAILVWECKQVEIIAKFKGHKLNGQCYDLMPVEYEIDRTKKIGFWDSSTNEISPISSTHDCNSVSGYVLFEGEWRKYFNDTHYDIIIAIQKVPSNIGALDKKEVSFKNNKLHSVYGPAGSQYREFLVNDLTALSAKHIFGHDVECDEQVSSRISGMIHDTTAGIRSALLWPIKLVILSILLLVVVYLIIARSWCHGCWSCTKHTYNRVSFRKEGDVVEIQE